MINIVTAYHTEAVPIIDYFRLKKQSMHTVFDTFVNDTESIRLTICGLGKLNASAAVMYAANTPPFSDSYCWLNIGIAGHHSMHTGTITIANKIIDYGNGQTWYPQIIFKSELTQTPLMTVDVPSEDYSPDFAVDMEASGYYSSAIKISTCEMIHCLKVISDNKHNSFKSLNKQKIISLIQTNIPEIETILHNLTKLADEITSAHYDKDTYQTLIESIRFTHSEQQLLKKALVKWHAFMPETPLDISYCLKFKSAKQVLQHLAEKNDQQPVIFKK